MRLKLLILLTIMLLVNATAAQDFDTPLAIDDVVDPEGDRVSLIHSAVLSPDGTKVVWHGNNDTGGLCVYRLADATNECFSLENNFRSVTRQWSPDSRYVAFHEDFFQIDN
jgi:hypothetical protein